ncbi:Putative S-adenosyl-L-methionine-dependent methyltransferase [Monoraphidium neglectum]|uniref:Putative S-adenosyl-L-methionine-dependent methyltransferase n=1 Tax=Monoraphidium neglectum TaxID=145388 RepID=A0A0D2KXG2_9CHLO|nr:Putative S-adenosyl-L-methionine-dependent methyltransferase [Monoraphidium neglectum]KIY99983.1 Putative S-adenosyl-L-methionine-dependent methyltransferase [Monoraphidium neglectum]|eukprot:XP_013899003.1 Putative S-adenosyl-L-methionine-dependent methyltransferase [Monoraphidium neglectum]
MAALDSTRPSVPKDDDAAIQQRWEALTNVSFWRAKAADEARHPATGAPLFTDPFSAAAAARCVPRAAAAKLEDREPGAGVGLRVQWMGVRTAEIDARVLEAARGLVAVAAEGSSLQVVILGAGLDARAWRLPWPRPPGGRAAVWEVDTAPILALKAHALEGFAVTACERREVACDLTNVSALASGLAQAGHDAAVPTVWVLEGLIGYFTTEDGLQLLHALAGLSAPGSRVVMTSPPSLKDKEEYEGRGITLHHSTFEETEDTLARARRAGWQGVIVTAEELLQRYGVERAQQLLLLTPAEAGGPA